MNVPSRKKRLRGSAIRVADMPGSSSLNAVGEVHRFQLHLRTVRRELAPPMTLAELYYDDFARSKGIRALRSTDMSEPLARDEVEALYVPFLLIIDLYTRGKLDLEYTLWGDDTVHTYEILGILRTEDPEDPRWTGPLTPGWITGMYRHMHPDAEDDLLGDSFLYGTE